MGLICLSECPSCQRHVRCGERACPFCGAQVSSSLRVLPYRILNRLDRSRSFSLGAALTAAGFVTSCLGEGQAVYGAPCNPPQCPAPQAGSAGQPSAGGSSAGGGAGGTNQSGTSSGGNAGEPAGGEPGFGGASDGGAAGAGGAVDIIEGGGWSGGQGGAAGDGG